MNMNGLSTRDLKNMSPEDLDLLRRMLEEASREQLMQERVSRIEAWEATNTQHRRREVVEDWNCKRFYYDTGLVLAVYPDEPIYYEMALGMESPYDTHAWHESSDDIEESVDAFQKYLYRHKIRAKREHLQYEDMYRRMGGSDE